MTGRRVVVADLSNEPGTTAALLLIALAVGTAAGLIAAALQIAEPSGSTSDAVILGGLAAAAVARSPSETLRILNAILASATVVGTLAWTVILSGHLDSRSWSASGVSAVAYILLGFGTWRLLSEVSPASARRRGLALAAGFAVLVAISAWVGLYPGVRAAVARRSAAPVETADDRRARQVMDSFDELDVASALIDQPARIASAVTALPPHARGFETFVLAVGGNGWQAIFDREAHRAAAVLTARTGGPALVLSNTATQVRGGLLASPRTVDLAIAAIGRRARFGDTLIVYLASHGGRNAVIAMDAPRLDFADLPARRLAADLDRAGLTRRVVIISACFGASWIPALASPTTIVIAAARADRTSFGCDDSRPLTVFGEAITGELARPLPLAEAFVRAKARVAAIERADGDTPSLPQAAVGAAMAGEWNRPPR